jgi:26S proteasome regulatory subunit N10
VNVPAGVNVLSDVLISSPVFTGDGEGGSGFAAAAAAGAAAAAAGVGGGDAFNYGVDPNLDPELALALRVSMEEERARQERAAKEAADKGEGAEQGGTSGTGKHRAVVSAECLFHRHEDALKEPQRPCLTLESDSLGLGFLGVL